MQLQSAVRATDQVFGPVFDPAGNLTLRLARGLLTRNACLSVGRGSEHHTTGITRWLCHNGYNHAAMPVKWCPDSCRSQITY